MINDRYLKNANIFLDSLYEDEKIESNHSNVDELIASYLETAKWASKDDAVEDWDELEFSPDAIVRARKDINDFLKRSQQYVNDLDMNKVMHDFFLTRNDHGAGFWDGDYEDSIGEELTKISKQMGQSDVYQGDDGFLYFY